MAATIYGSRDSKTPQPQQPRQTKPTDWVPMTVVDGGTTESDRTKSVLQQETCDRSGPCGAATRILFNIIPLGCAIPNWFNFADPRSVTAGQMASRSTFHRPKRCRQRRRAAVTSSARGGQRREGTRAIAGD
eukprot:GHVU01131872.1.p2 GENE.GHVU01131872.1~~GHVU01131872.1.p2  ORF type:complete len:132 (+),score=6.25 GHVU01131872.1:1358-1753(+)